MKKLGLIVNPIAGMGGKVGLKGTDGTEILDKAIELGAKEEAGEKTKLALNKLESIKEEIFIVTCSEKMGEDYCNELGFKNKVVYSYYGNSSKEDTKLGLKEIIKEEVDLILFVGGDGTARDIYETIGESNIVLGIPAGVKIYSPVYGNTPQQSGKLALSFLNKEIKKIREVEVVDIDEEAYRKDIFRTELFGYLMIPDDRKFTQNKKAPTPLSDKANQKAIALDIIDNMEENTYYIIGPGTSTREVLISLGLEYTLLGVDIIKNKKLIGKDVSENEILNIIKNEKSVLIITPTGGQGYLIGRGNQQISGEVLKKIGKENIQIIATQSKILELIGRPLLIYSGDENIDINFSGYYRLKIGYNRDFIYKVAREV